MQWGLAKHWQPDLKGLDDRTPWQSSAYYLSRRQPREGQSGAADKCRAWGEMAQGYA